MISPEDIRECQQNDREAQCRIYQELSRNMFGLCLRYAENRKDAEDILHDGFMHIFRKIGDFRGEGSFEGWARRIFVNIALSRIRRKKNYQREVDLDKAKNVCDISTDVLSNIESQEILLCMSKLPQRYKLILNLFSIEGYSHQEIADELSISVENSRVTLLRAKAQLCELLTEAGILENEYRR